VDATIFDLYFHGRDNDYGHGYKEYFKDIFYHQKWNNNVKKREEKCGANLTLQAIFLC